MTIRVLMLRCLLSWWMIPGAWLVLFPLLWLVFGSGTFEDMKGFTRLLWNGHEEKAACN